MVACGEVGAEGEGECVGGEGAAFGGEGGGETGGEVVREGDTVESALVEESVAAAALTGSGDFAAVRGEEIAGCGEVETLPGGGDWGVLGYLGDGDARGEEGGGEGLVERGVRERWIEGGGGVGSRHDEGPCEVGAVGDDAAAGPAADDGLGWSGDGVGVSGGDEVAEADGGFRP